MRVTLLGRPYEKIRKRRCRIRDTLKKVSQRGLGSHRPHGTRAGLKYAAPFLCTPFTIHIHPALRRQSVLFARLRDACDVHVAPRSKITSAISTKFRPVLHFTSAHLHYFSPSSLFLSLLSQYPLWTSRISPSVTLTRKTSRTVF
jgi:hypothetical protein